MHTWKSVRQIFIKINIMLENYNYGGSNTQYVWRSQLPLKQYLKTYTMHKLIFLFLTIPFFLNAQDPVSIVEASRDAVKVSSFEAISTLTIIDSKGNQRVRRNTMASKTYPDKTEKRIIKFISPEEVKGTGILIFDYEDKQDDMWIYLPALRKTRRIVSSEKSNSFMGSEFSNADMTAPSVTDFNYELLGTETKDGVACWKLAAAPKTTDLEDDYGYRRSIRWIGKDDNVVRYTEYYDYSGELMKSIETVNFKLLDPGKGKYMVTEMIAENHQNGRSSGMKMEQIQISESDDKLFTIQTLER